MYSKKFKHHHYLFPTPDAAPEGPDYVGYAAAVEAVEFMGEALKKLQGSGTLTERGVKEKMTAFHKEHLTKLEDKRKLVLRDLKWMREQHKATRTSAVPELKENDVLGFLRDQELRRWWGELDNDRRTNARLAMTEGKYPELAAALLRGSDLVTGLLPSRRELLLTAFQTPEDRERAEGFERRIRRLEASEEAIEVAERAIADYAGLGYSDRLAAEGKPTLTDALKMGYKRREELADPATDVPVSEMRNKDSTG